MGKTLRLQQGSAADWEIRLFDTNGDPEDLTGADAAHVSIRDTADDATPLLSRSTAAADLTIDVAGAKLVASLSQVEADALVEGEYRGQASVRIAGKWLVTRPFRVSVEPVGVLTA